MTLGRFDNPSASDIGSGLVPVPPPIKKSDVAAVRKDYGIAASFKPKGQSDQSLYSHSVKFVIDWWKRKRATDAGKGTVPGSTGTKATGTKAGSAPGKTGSGGGLAPRKTGATLPNTAMGTSQGPAKILPHIQTASEKAAQKIASQRGQVIATRSTPAPQSYPNTTSNISGVVSKATAQSILTQMGLRGVTPPASVLTSASALRAWATSQLRSRNANASRMTRAGI
jgi:hypothetical protein